VELSDVLLNLIIGLASGGVTSIAVTSYFTKREKEENLKLLEKEKNSKKSLEQREEYIDFKRYLHDLKQYTNNIYHIWDMISTSEEELEETKKNLRQLIRYLSSKPYNVTKDFKHIFLDQSAIDHLNDIEASVEELHDFSSDVLANKINYNQGELLDRVLNLVLSLQKTRVTKKDGNRVTCDFV
jgi:mannitol-specific phosphotransferase system IIBC component